MKSDIRNFDPLRFAELDTAMWQAYYRHNFLRLFILLCQLCYQYTRPNPLLTCRTAYHSARAAMVFRQTKGNEDLSKVRMHLDQFYKLISGHNVTPFDYQKAAELELTWWLIDRYPTRYKETRADALSKSMATIYNVSPESLEQYGQQRAAAMVLLGSHHYDKTHMPDWDKIESLLVIAYRSLHVAVQSK